MHFKSDFIYRLITTLYAKVRPLDHIYMDNALLLKVTSPHIKVNENTISPIPRNIACTAKVNKNPRYTKHTKPIAMATCEVQIPK